MRQLLFVSLLTTGCSLVYNPNNLPAPVDAPADAEVPYDADPGALALSSVFPGTIDEGRGTGGSRAAVIVINGTNIVSDGLAVTIAPTDGSSAMLTMVDAPIAAADHNHLAFTLAAEVDGTLAEGVVVPLTVTVTQTGADPQTIDGISLVGHEELKPSDVVSGAIDISTLKPMYSSVDLLPDTGDQAPTVTFTGTSALKGAVIIAAGSIRVGELHADGSAGTSSAAGKAAPGSSCGAGGAAGNQGGCSSSGGGSGVTSGGGGGGGGAMTGAQGFVGGSQTAGTGGAAGVPATAPTIVDLTAAVAGGGGGGGSGGLGGGSNGGGGGGAIVLRAGGTITAGAISANGGAGQSSNTVGGGGGGAGGIVALIAGTTIDATPSAIGGAGGTCTSGIPAKSCNGGDGSVGVVRWDSPTSTLPTGAHRGPSFLTTPLTATSQPTITAIGNAGDAYSGYDGGDDGDDVPLTAGTFAASSGHATLDTHLAPGYNVVCVYLGSSPTPSLASTCVDIAYLPDFGM
ncbi:MAG TPA: hypothetical protein VGM88_20250 [Kofleriaceae bacterium]|jgi:hypothetical protein